MGGGYLIIKYSQLSHGEVRRDPTAAFEQCLGGGWTRHPGQRNGNAERMCSGDGASKVLRQRTESSLKEHID